MQMQISYRVSEGSLIPTRFEFSLAPATDEGVYYRKIGTAIIKQTGHYNVRVREVAVMVFFRSTDNSEIYAYCKDEETVRRLREEDYVEVAKRVDNWFRSRITEVVRVQKVLEILKDIA